MGTGALCSGNSQALKKRCDIRLLVSQQKNRQYCGSYSGQFETVDFYKMFGSAVLSFFVSCRLQKRGLLKVIPRLTYGAALGLWNPETQDAKKGGTCATDRCCSLKPSSPARRMASGSLEETVRRIEPFEIAQASAATAKVTATAASLAGAGHKRTVAASVVKKCFCCSPDNFTLGAGLQFQGLPGTCLELADLVDSWQMLTQRPNRPKSQWLAAFQRSSPAVQLLEGFMALTLSSHRFQNALSLHSITKSTVLEQ